MACSYLIDQALMRLRAETRQDTQAILYPRRISPFNGVWNKIDLPHTTYVLPEKGVRFHVYQVGQLYPLLIGLFPKQDKWITLAENCNIQNMICNVYNDKGIEMPRYECWYLVTNDRNLLLAVKEQTSIKIDLNMEKLYFRVYTNAFFNKKAAGPLEQYVKVFGRTITKDEDMAYLREEYDKYRKANLNMPLLYVNGYKTNILNFSNIKHEDVVEFVVDTSVYKFVEWPVTSLLTFDSLKDLKRKYLLHYATANTNADKLNYNDDIDFYIVRKDPKGLNPVQYGFYYHRNQDDAVRNVTHRDYAMTVDYVADYIRQELPLYSSDQSMKGWYVQMYVRDDGWDRPLESIHNRIKELYKLPNLNVVQALHGINSNIPEWRADNLENSDYMTVVSSRDYNLDQTVTENAWGYNAAAKMTSDTPTKVEVFSSRKTIPLPTLLRRYSSGFEYDAEGKFLGHYNHVAGDRYICRQADTALVEMLSGYSSAMVDEYFNQKYVKHDPDFQWRIYQYEKRPDDGIFHWEDVTDTNRYSIDTDQGLIILNIDLDEYDVIVRSNKNVLVQEYDLLADDGLLYVQMSYLASRTGTIYRYRLDIPFGELDVIMNGYSLVQHVDYYVDGSKLCIVNKKFLKGDPMKTLQKVVIRSYAFSDYDDIYVQNPKEEYGFVQYNTLSRNNKFDIRDDRIMRINVAGRVFHRDDLGFSEDNTSITAPGNFNGAPYEIKDIPVQFRGIVEQDEYEYRRRSLDLDNRLSDYMSQFIKDKPMTVPSPIPEHWPVFSPFCIKVISDLKDGILDNQAIRQHYDDNFVIEFTQAYRHLLNVDPTQADTRYDDRFVKVHPTHLMTVIDIDAWQYKFMERVIKVILDSQLDLSSFARIKL